MINKRTAIAGVVGLALAGAGAIGSYTSSVASAARSGTRASAAAAVPTYDAKTDAAAAAQAMNTWCQQPGSCTFSSPPVVTDELGPFRALSDKVINCNQTDVNGLGENALLAETETTQADTRGQGTTLEESLDAEVKLGILKTELEASTKQHEEIKNGTEVKQAVEIPPDYEGYVVTRWPTVLADGTITDGIHFQVTSFELSYPGFGTGSGDLSKIYVAPLALPLEDASAMPPRDDRAKYCNGLPKIVVGTQLARATRGPVISVCVAGHRKCTKEPLDLANASGLLSGNASVGLARGSRVYATGTDKKGRITVHAARPLRRGSYTLFINRPRHETMVSAKLG